MRFSLVAVSFALLAAAPVLAQKKSASASAEAKQSAAHVKTAEHLYGAGKYLEAAAELEKAQALTPHPRILYNLARAWDQGGELDKALAAYQAYVGSSDGTDPTLLKRSALSIDRLRGVIAQREEAAQAAEAERARLDRERQEAEARTKAEREAKLRAEEERALALERQLQTTRENRSRAKVTAFAFGGGAVAAAGAGLFFGLNAASARSAFSAADTVEEKAREATETRRHALFADVGFGVSVAAAVAAILFYPKGEEPAVRLADSPGGAGVEVRF